MKKIIKFLFNSFCFIISLFVNLHIINFFRRIKYGVLSFAFKRKLKKHGKNTKISSDNIFEGLNNIEIGDDFRSGKGLWLAAYSKYYNINYTPSIIIGNNVSLSKNCHIGCINKITIKDNVLIGSNVLIEDHSHGLSNDFSTSRDKLPLVSKGEIEIGENCWIGDNVVILANISIGKNCIIGANSVVTKSFKEDFVLIAGNPAKIIKSLKE